MDLHEKTAFIMGAGRGIGRATAQLFSNNCANIVISSRTEAELTELEYQLTTAGNQNVLALAADATNQRDVANLISETMERFGRIDYFVYASGVGNLKPFAELTLDDLDRQYNVNVRGAFINLQSVLPIMAEQKFGRVVAIPGILGKVPMAQASTYWGRFTKRKKSSVKADFYVCGRFLGVKIEWTPTLRQADTEYASI